MLNYPTLTEVALPQNQRAGGPRVWVISEVFSPDETATAHYMAGIAEALAKVFPVEVLCVQPTYTGRGIKAARDEFRDGLHIHRCVSTTFDKNRFLLRLVNILTISVSLTLAAARLMRRGDLALVVTNPPLLPFLVELVCLLKGARCMVRLDDLYSEMLVASGMLSRKSMRYRFLARCSRWLYRHADALVVLGTDMKQLVCQRCGAPEHKVLVIPNWSDSEEVRPSPSASNPLLQQLGLEQKFVVLCAGNLGRVQAIESLVAAARRLQNYSHIHFLFIGTGSKSAWLEKQKRLGNLQNLTLLPPRPRHDQNLFLNACNIGVTALIKGMWGAAVPSRLYNLLAAGKPVLVVGHPASEAALVVQQQKIGWVAPPEAPDEIANTLLAASTRPGLLAHMGQNARRLAQTQFDRETVVRRYVEAVCEIEGLSVREPANPQFSPVSA